MKIVCYRSQTHIRLNRQVCFLYLLIVFRTGRQEHIPFLSLRENIGRATVLRKQQEAILLRRVVSY